MRTNGTIQLGTMSGAGVNEWGEPIEGELVFSDKIPCSIKTNSDTRKGVYEDGVFRMASYTILVELQNCEMVTNVKVERLGEALGEYQVLSSEPLDTVGRTQIIV